MLPKAYLFNVIDFNTLYKLSLEIKAEMLYDLEKRFWQWNIVSLSAAALMIFQEYIWTNRYFLSQLVLMEGSALDNAGS